MRIVVLTTETKHHKFFVNKLIEDGFNVTHAFFEEKKLTKPYPTGPFFEEEQDAYEEQFFKNPILRNYPKHLETHTYYSVNEKDCVEKIRKAEPDIGFVFGTGKLESSVYKIPRLGFLNIHRGDIAHYRGLDSDLWAIYEKRYNNIATTLHFIDEELDAGDIVYSKSLDLNMVNEIYEIRYFTTLIAYELVHKFLNEIASQPVRNLAKKQENLGKYYSAMPLEKKMIALKNFKESKLNEK